MHRHRESNRHYKTSIQMTKCEGIECPIKHQCARFTIKAEDIQCYLTYPPYKDGNCKFYISTKPEIKKVKK